MAREMEQHKQEMVVDFLAEINDKSEKYDS